MMEAKKYDDAYNRQTIRHWSDLTDDLLLLVMMKIDGFDFLAFSGVCKSWRSVGVSKRNKIIVSKPPLSISISKNANQKECFYLHDYEGRMLKITLPHLAGRECLGVSCGYMILFGKKTFDFWLVNPITRHQLHFPDIPFIDEFNCKKFRCILAFSPAISGWVFAVFTRYKDYIWLCLAGKQNWTKLSTTFQIYDYIAFKGKIYTVHSVYESDEVRLCELKVYPEPKLVLLETENFPKPIRYPGFMTCGQNLYLIDLSLHGPPFSIHELDLDKMKWVSREKDGKEYSFFFHDRGWLDKDLQYGRYVVTGVATMRYFFFDCLNVDLMHTSMTC